MEWLNRLLGKKSTPQVPANVAKLQKEADHLYVLRLGGVFNKPTLDKIQAIAEQDMARGVTDFKLLLILSDFRGWRKGDDWGDMEFGSSGFCVGHHEHKTRGNVAVPGQFLPANPHGVSAR